LLTEERYRIDLQKIALDQATEEVRQKTREMIKSYELAETKACRDLENEHEKAKAQLMQKNVDADTLRFDAIANVRDSLSYRQFEGCSSKLDPNDIVSVAAKRWFDQKKVSEK
jgi:predicted phage gp36 major capsid-like protein